MISDIEIANSVIPNHINKVAKSIGLSEDDIDLYGKYKAKINSDNLNISNNPDGKLILVTAINPTPAGEGKTTVTIGLGQAMKKLGKKTIITLREPSLGPVFGLKGGATGGGYSQVLPMEDINLHFTGDIHAITAANNLICAMLDNHIFQGNNLRIDTNNILIKRCMDINDRALRNTNIGLGGKNNGVPREDGFIISVASEIMAILCLSQNISDLKKRIGDILIAYTTDKNPIFVKDLNAQGAAASLLKEAIKPNLVQTIEGVPAIIHGGPFANIAHGCNSLIATKLALKLSDYCITEAGFGADLGAEKFLDIKCRLGNLTPCTVVIVSTIRALKYNGGVSKDKLKHENLSALKSGIVNLGVHIQNMKKFGIPVVVALNKFETDTDDEIEIIKNFCKQENCDFAPCDVFTNGGNGGIQLAQAVCDACNQHSKFEPIYDLNMSIKDKILSLAQNIYRADNVIYSPLAQESIKNIEKLGKSSLPICVAKTQYSISDDPNKLGHPKNFNINIKDVQLSSGAGFIVVLCGDILRMPGLPKKPAAENIDIDENGKISGLF